MVSKASLSLAETVERYLHTLEVDRMASATIAKHASHLRTLMGYFGADTPARLVLASDPLDDYREERSMSGVAYSTLRADKTVIGRLVTYAMRKRIVKYGPNPVDEWKNVKELPHDFIRIPVEKWPTVMDMAANPRDRFLWAVGLGTFCRVSEIHTMTFKDVIPNEGRPEIHITRWKKNKTADLRFFPWLTDELIRWQTAYNQNLLNQGIAWNDNFPLIPRLVRMQGEAGPNGQFNRATLINPYKGMDRPQKIIHQGLRNLGYENTDREGMHTMRRSGALAYYKHLVNLGVSDPAAIVMDLLGHESVTTTEIYLGTGYARDRAAKQVSSDVDFMRPAAVNTGLRRLQIVR